MINHYKTTPLFQYMSKNLRPNAPFVDIGANVGIYSYLARQLGAVSYAFEPEPMHYLFLSRNKAFCDRAYDIALSDHEGFSPFFISGDAHQYGSSLVPSRKGWEQSGYRVFKTVKTNRLDNLFSPEEASRFQFIKIDVEGAEAAVLMGMKGLLEGAFRGPIWCEVRGDQSDRNPGSYREVTRFLSNYDYIPYIYKNFSKHTFTDTDTRRVFDLLFEKAMHVS
jgi:FkbM family methyltransferase